MGSNNIEHSSESEEYTVLVEPKIVKYLRYFVIFVLLASIVWVMRGLEYGVTPGDILQEHFFYFFFIMTTLVYMSLPYLVQRGLGYAADRRLVIAIAFFFIAGPFLGQAFNLFEYIPWWDKMLHLVSGAILALIAFSLIPVINVSAKEVLKVSPLFAALFAFCFAVMGGVFWEIGEYLIDWAFGTNMQCWADDPTLLWTGRTEQGAGLIDTMEDLMACAIGAFIASAVGYRYLSRGKKFIGVKKIRNGNGKNNK